MYMYIHVRTLVQLLLEEANTHRGTVGFAPENFVSLTLSVLKITSNCNSLKVFAYDSSIIITKKGQETSK